MSATADLPASGRVQRRGAARPQRAASPDRLSLATLVGRTQPIVVKLDALGVVRSVSENAADTLGVSISRLVGRSALDSAHPDDRPVITAVFASLACGEWTGAPIRARVKGPAGGWIVAEGIVRPLTDSVMGDFAGAVALLRDYDAEEAVAGRLGRVETFLREHAPGRRVGLAVVSRSSIGSERLLGCTDAFRELVGRPGEDIFGDPLEAIVARRQREDPPRGFSVGRTTVRDGNGAPPFRFVRLEADATEPSQQIACPATSNGDMRALADLAAHDLGAPLRSLAARAEGLADVLDMTGDPVTERLLDDIRRRICHLQGVVSDMLECVHPDAFQAHATRVDAAVIVREAIELCAAEPAAAQAHVKVGDLPFVHGDACQLRRVFQNLICNAYQHSRRQPPEIEIGGRPTSDGWEFWVLDRGQSPAAGPPLGHGLGLFICRRIVDLHGGKFAIEPRDGGGTAVRFTVTDDAVRDRPSPATA